MRGSNPVVNLQRVFLPVDNGARPLYHRRSRHRSTQTLLLHSAVFYYTFIFTDSFNKPMLSLQLLPQHINNTLGDRVNCHKRG